MSVVEALACNCPVIISDKVGLWPGIKSSDAGWVIPNDAKALVESISQALDNPKIALQKGLNGNTWVKNNFDIQKIGTDFIHLYQQLRK
jgi:glycosyltransferase involved in cell wall biosynthesis